MAQQAERQMGKLIWDFLNGESDQRVRDEVSRAVIGGSPPGRLSCWNGPTPGVDLLFADEHDVLQACVELKRRYGPSQYSSVRHLKGAALFRSGDGKVDPVSNAKSAQCWTARTWTQVLAELDAATTPRIGVLRDALDSLR